jgi:predicted acyltransferase
VVEGRVASIDRVRGLTVLLMLFVNELAGVSGAPGFLLHAQRGTDRMTLTDVVFPAFLFVVGMAIPFALAGRLRREGRAAVWRHVLGRAAALIVIGVLMVNAEKAAEGALLSPPAWNMLMTLGVLAIWQAPGDEGPRRGLRALGIALLLALALLYRAPDATGLVQLRPLWWGILGLIGWAYLVAAASTLLLGDRPLVLTGLAGLLYLLDVADAMWAPGWLLALRPHLSVGPVIGTHGAVVTTGCALGAMLRRAGAGEPARALALRGLGFAAALAAAGWLLHALHGLHPVFWMSKLSATPPWGLLSSAATAAAWAGVHALGDAPGGWRWPPAVAMAGENALLAYLLAPFLLSLFAWSVPAFGNNPYEALGGAAWLGLVRAAAFAWVVVRLCGLLRRRGVRMQL